MSRIAYVNGRYVRHAEAAVHIEDRGYQFADGVYEVITVKNGHLADEKGHLQRLERSLTELRIDRPIAATVLPFLLREIVRRNRLHDGSVYLQITRGVAPREFAFPASARPALVITARPAAKGINAKQEQGVSIITVPDQRWARRDIKTIALLPQVLAKQAAVEAGAYEAWMILPDRTVSEGASSNAWIVAQDGTLITRQANRAILKGITRNSLSVLAERLGMRIEERPFTLAEARDASEAFLSSANTLATPIIAIDGQPIGQGKPGPTVTALRRAYLDYAATPSDAQFDWQQASGAQLD